MACWTYEGMLLFGVLFIAGYLFGTLTQTRNAMDNRHGLQAFLFLIFGIYFVWLWSKGQTLAMKTWNIRLVDVQGRPVSQARALLRYLLSWIWLLPSLSLVWLLGLPAAGLVIHFGPGSAPLTQANHDLHAAVVEILGMGVTLASVADDGNGFSLDQAQIAVFIVMLVLGWVAIYATLSRFHPQRQFWHDALAGTRLISSPAKNPQTT